MDRRPYGGAAGPLSRKAVAADSDAKALAEGIPLAFLTVNNGRKYRPDVVASWEDHMPTKPWALPLAAAFMFGFLALVLATPFEPVQAQDYPNRPVTILVPLAAGGAMDIIARSLAPKLAARLGKPVLVEERVGAGTVLAANDVAHGAADGYTLLDAPSGTLTTNVTLYKSLSYDPIADFVPIALYCQVPFVLVTNPSQPFKTIPELIAYAKANPGKLSFGSTGTGAVPHLAGEMLKNMAGIDMVHVPYKGGPPALNDIMGDQIQLFFADTAITPPLIAAGKIRALGVSSKTPVDVLPGVPPIADALPGFEAVSWHLIVAQSGTPRPIVDRLHDEFKTVIKSPEIGQQMMTMGLIPIDTPSVEELQRFVKSEIARWGDVVRKVGIAGTE
jgi:tripartite-type tricarboxylate transporter receptor subunit TctC